MASRLADILNQEYKSKGLISGASSALGKRAKEKYVTNLMLLKF